MRKTICFVLPFIAILTITCNNPKKDVTKIISSSQVENGRTIEELTSAYNKAKEVLQGVTSLDDFEKNKDTVKQTVLDGLKAALVSLQEMKDSGASRMELMTAFEKIKKVYMSMDDELEIEFKRIRELPDADDPGLVLQGELMGYSSPIKNNMKLLWMEMK